MSEKSKKINENSLLGELLELKGSDKVLKDNNVPCIHCPMAQMELNTLKLNQICKMYGLDEKKLIKELNELI